VTEDRPPARVLCVSGDSGSGKTALIRRLLPRLARPRDEIAVVKHTHHAIDWHPAGKDSAALWDAGPAVLAVAGPDQTAMFEREAAAPSSARPAASAPPETREGETTGRGGDGAPAADPDARAAATRRLVRVCRRLPAGIRLVLAEGFRDARAPALWTAAGPPGPGRVPPGVVAAVVPAGDRERWTERHAGTEVLSREDADAIAARVGDWAEPVAELTRG
jgi:molybdopterin-guanine dinucleotide biosynthesis protein